MNDQDLEDIANEAFYDQYQGDNFRKSLLHAVKTAMAKAYPPSGGEVVATVMDDGEYASYPCGGVIQTIHAAQVVAIGTKLYTSPRVADDSMIERGAVALANLDRKHPSPVAYWQWLHEDERAKFKERAKAALQAALGEGK